MVELLVDARARLGECVLWCDQTAALYWTDIEGATLSRWNSADVRSRVAGWMRVAASRIAAIVAERSGM